MGNFPLEFINIYRLYMFNKELCGREKDRENRLGLDLQSNDI
jgi:hypothetical protein